METGEIPATIGIKRLNPKIDFRGGRLRVVDAPREWPSELPYRRASINSFGYGGANAHAVIDAASSYLEAHPKLVNSTIPAAANGTSCNGHSAQTNGICASDGHHDRIQKASKHVYVMAFSAHDEPTLRKNIKAIAAQADNQPISDLAYTLGCRRSAFPHRAFRVISEEEVSSQLVDENVKFGLQKTAQTVIAFAFTGQGAQWPQMGYALAMHFPSVRETLQRLDCVLGNVPNPPDWTILGTYNPLTNRYV